MSEYQAYLIALLLLVGLSMLCEAITCFTHNNSHQAKKTQKDLYYSDPEFNGVCAECDGGIPVGHLTSNDKGEAVHAPSYKESTCIPVNQVSPEQWKSYLYGEEKEQP